MAESYGYDKVLDFFSEHETAIYGLGPTDYGAEEGTLLWCIKELDDIYDCSRYFNASVKEDGTTIRDQILKVLCCLMDIYEEKNADGYSDRVRGHRIENPLTDSPLVLPGEIITTSEMEAIIKPIEEEEKSSTCCETCKNYESSSDITGWCSACPGTVIKGMNMNNTCAAYEKRMKQEDDEDAGTD